MWKFSQPSRKKFKVCTVCSLMRVGQGIFSQCALYLGIEMDLEKITLNCLIVPIGTIRQLRVIFSKSISIPKYKAHCEKIPWPTRIKEHTVHTLNFLREGWLNFHIPYMFYILLL